jgi:hypothetical protein
LLGESEQILLSHPAAEGKALPAGDFYLEGVKALVFKEAKNGFPVLPGPVAAPDGSGGIHRFVEKPQKITFLILRNPEHFGDGG